jgi:N-acetylglutamate synthase-like GNAT family acetyltransferase
MQPMNIVIRPKVYPLYTGIWQLREEVLRKPLGMSLVNENLSMDEGDTYVAALVNEQVIGCLLLHKISADIIKFRQMAVHPEWQGKQVGRALMQAGEAHAKMKGYKVIELNARAHVSGFYSTLGFHEVGELFEEVNIPHIKMLKNL